MRTQGAIDAYRECTMNLLRLKVVLAAFEYDDASEAVLRVGRQLAEAAGAALHVVHVTASMVGREAERGTPDPERLEAVRAAIARAGFPAATPVNIVDGDPAHAIRSTADQIRADVIVLGPHRERAHAGARPLGSTALAVATSSWAPCLIVGHQLSLPIRRVLVPVDLSDTARGALMTGLSWASALRGGDRGNGSATSGGVTLTALLVNQLPEPGSDAAAQSARLERELTHVRGRAGTWAGVAIQSAVVDASDVAEAIADFARQHGPDLVVLGTRGLGLDKVGRLGSVSLAVAKRLDLPVLLVPPAVWGELAKSA